VTRDEIQAAVKCPVWQEFRKGLKGTPTEMKLRLLRGWVREGCWKGDCDEATRRVQVLNYLHALSRGGQIDPIDGIEALLERTIHVRR